jgi:3-keto-5-aminohexanoate cleavage enzyme
MNPIMIEVAVHELATKEQNPNIPYSIQEVTAAAIECARAGASIVHFHARDAVTGEQRWYDADYYREAFKRIRAESDVILYPTQLAGGIDHCPHVIALAEEGLELATIDIMPPKPHSPDAADLDPNPEVMAELRRRGVAYSLGVREISHMRYLQVYRDRGLIDDVVAVKIFLSAHLHGPTPDARGLLMYLDHVPPGMSCDWFTTMLGASDEATFNRVSMLAAAMGGHIRTGLGDNPTFFGSGRATNAEHVRRAVDLAHAAGREVATPEQSRAMLGIRSSKANPSGI